jgi:anti-sigma factor RsiW
MTTPACSSPLPFETLVDYWMGDLDREASERAEEHLFTCAACTDASARTAALLGALRSLVPPVVSGTWVEQLVRRGAHIRTTDVQPGVRVTVAFSPGVDLLVHRLQGDLSRADRVDCEVLDASGTRLLTLDHVPFDRQRGQVLIACQRHYIDQYPPDICFRISALAADGTRTIREYRVFHDAERP